VYFENRPYLEKNFIIKTYYMLNMMLKKVDIQFCERCNELTVTSWCKCTDNDENRFKYMSKTIKLANTW